MGAAGGTSATGGTGGSGGTGMTTDAGGGGGASSSDAGDGSADCGGLFCDDFEASATFDPKKWTLNVGYNAGNTLVVDATMPAHGKRAAHAHLVDTEAGFATLQETKTFPALADSLWGRAYFYITVSTTAGHTMVANISAGTKAQLEVGLYLGKWQLTFYDTNGEHPIGSTATFPRNQWTCLEWHFARTGTNLIELYVDGAATMSYASGGATAQSFTSMSLGIENHSSSPPTNDVYVDDVVIDSQRLHCLP
jgi:hypothetical protein